MNNLPEKLFSSTFIDQNISIVIPTCKRIEKLSNLLDEVIIQIRNLDLVNSIDIIVSDDDPKLSAHSLKNKYKNVNFIVGMFKGLTGNRLALLKATTSDWLLYIDDDCLPGEQWLSSYISAINRNLECSFFSGPVLQTSPRSRMDQEAPQLRRGPGFYGCNFLIKRSLLSKIGNFNLSYPFHLEDIELSLRIKRNGSIMIFCDTATVIHPWRTIPSIQGKWLEFLAYIKLVKDYPEISSSFRPIVRSKLFVSKCVSYSNDLIKFRGRGFLKATQLLFLEFLKIFLFIPVSLS